MYYESQNLVYSRAFMDTVLDAYKTVPGGALITAPTLRLLQGALPAITPDTALADLVALEANFSGYGADTFTLTVPVQSSTNVQCAIGSGTFVATTASPFVGNTITGYFVTDGTNLVASEAFPLSSPVPIDAVGKFLTLNVALPGNLFQPAA